MKKTICLLLALLLVFLFTAVGAYAAPVAVSVFINNEPVAFPNQGPFWDADTGLAYVPLRLVSEALGAAVDWDGPSQTARVDLGDTVVSVTVGSNQTMVNNKNVELEGPALVQNQRVMVPLCFISESLGKVVEWNEDERTVYVGAEPAPFIRMASTIGPVDAGIVEALAKYFEEKTGIRVEYVGAGTGKALEMSKTGDFDLVQVHAKALEEQFVAEGYGTERIDLMYNDFVIVGPAADPAGIKGHTPSDALEQIMVSESVFISRGDRSGTHVKEMELWADAGIDPSGDWYRAWEGGPQGNTATLRYTDEQQAYTVIDRATYLVLKNEITLAVLVEKDESLLNFITLIPINPETFPQVKHDLVIQFIELCTADEAQAMIRDFKKEIYGESLFFPNSAQWHSRVEQ